MKARFREHPEMIIEAGTAYTRAWPLSSGFVTTGSTPNPPRNLGGCVLTAVQLKKSRDTDRDELFIDVNCSGGEARAMVPLYSKPEFQKHVASILEENVGRKLEEIDEIEIDWPKDVGQP